MSETDLQQRIIDALGIMHTAIKNVQLYPPNSPSISNTIEKFYAVLLNLLEEESPIVIAEAEKKAIICGKTLDTKDLEKVQISTLIFIMLNHGIKSIFFDRGIDKEELDFFIHCLAKSPEEIKHQGGFTNIMRAKKIHHIYLDEKVFISMDRYQKIISEKGEAPQKESLENLSAEKLADTEKEALRLLTAMLGENTEQRMEASKQFAALLQPLPLEWQRGFVSKELDKLIAWMKIETEATPEYDIICGYLREQAQSFLKQERFAEALPIFSVLHQINVGALKKNDAIRKAVSRTINNLATEDHIRLLLNEFSTNKRKQQNDAHEILVAFDDIILERLLDIVRDATDTNERVRVINLIREMGARAIPAVKSRIKESAPWYYLRNLAYILGHIGNEENAYVLQPLLLHKHGKVKTEALKSIYQTGGAQRGQLLLSVLPQVDGEFRVSIIEMLGKLKYEKAVPQLLEILKNKSLISKDEDIAMQEKVCDALGAIGSPDALKSLKEIHEAKSFLGIGTYPVKIRYAAKRAMDSILRKQQQ
ncbi:MAG TPA: HEAT repeat domain-containing protein [Smithella sp.]|nr:HEAT repeat domain-containing protein [Smithella sp.]